MTGHHGRSQFAELLDARRGIKIDDRTRNKSLATLRLEHRAVRRDSSVAVANEPGLPRVQPQRKTGHFLRSDPFV
jgi:hypothetical protein